jgi:hypothetical protein
MIPLDPVRLTGELGRDREAPLGAEIKGLVVSNGPLEVLLFERPRVRFVGELAKLTELKPVMMDGVSGVCASERDL